MEDRSLSETLTRLLEDAKTEHHVAVFQGKATDEDWPKWYGEYMAKRLTCTVTGMQVRPGCGVRSSEEPKPVEVHVRGSWDGGPSWQAEVASEGVR